MASLRDIAAACGLSINAVSEILNRGNEARYRPETCAKVRAAAERLAYVPNRAAQSMRSRRSRVIGFVTENASPTRDSIYHTSLYSFVVGLSHTLIDAGHHLAVLDLFELTVGSHDPRARMLDELFFVGLVAHQGRLGSPGELESRVQVPVVWYDAQNGSSQRHVRRDEFAIGRQLVRELHELGQRRIAVVLPTMISSVLPDLSGFHYSIADRLAGYRAAMAELGLTPCIVPSLQPELVAQTVRHECLTALVTMGTTEFVSLLVAAGLLGFRVGHELSLAAFDIDARRDDGGLPAGGMLYDRYAAGQEAGAMLLKRLGDAAHDQASVAVGGTFTPGATVGRLA